MKVNKFGRAAILSPSQITLLFNEGFTKARDRALFGVCLYAAVRINEACTLLGEKLVRGHQTQPQIICDFLYHFLP